MIPLSDIPLADDIALNEEIEELQMVNQRLLAENAALRRKLKQAHQLIAQLKFLLQRHL